MFFKKYYIYICIYIGNGRRGKHCIFLKHKSHLSFEKSVLGQLFCLTGLSSPSPNPCVYCRALWFPSSGPLGYQHWHRAWVLLPFLPAHLRVPSHWILQSLVLILHTSFFVICSYSGVPFAGCCAQPSLLCLQLSLWLFPPFWGFCFVLFWFYGCSEVLKELLTAHGKLSKHSTQATRLPLPSFPVPHSFLLGIVEKPGLLGFGWSACAAFRQHAGLDLPALTAAQAS